MAGSSIVPTSIKPSTSASTDNHTEEPQREPASAMADLRQSGINFNISFIGSIVVENSLTRVESDVRHDVCSACIRIVCSQAGKMASFETPEHIQKVIGKISMDIKDCNVDMNVSMNVLLIILLDATGTEKRGMMRINIRDISFVSKGSDDDLDKYICFVAKRLNPKTKQVERRCYVFYCESDPYNVVNTISLAFKLREEHSGINTNASTPNASTPSSTLSPRSMAIDCPTPTVTSQDDPDATPRATATNMNPFRMPSIDEPSKPTTMVSPMVTVNHHTPSPPPPSHVPRPNTLGEMYQNPTTSSRRLPDVPAPPPLPGPRSKPPNVAIEPSTPVTPDGCTYEELNLPQKKENLLKKDPPKDVSNPKGVTYIDQPYTHRRSRSSSPNDIITIPQMFKNAQPADPIEEKSSKNPLGFLRQNLRNSLPRVIFGKSKSTSQDDNSRASSSEADNHTTRVQFKAHADIINTGSIDNDAYVDDSPRGVAHISISDVGSSSSRPSRDSRSISPAKKVGYLVEEISDFLSTQQWFHGTITRDAAERRLNRDGDFLIRQSTHCPGQMILSGMEAGQKKHIQLIDEDGKIRTADSEFNSVIQLINYHFGNSVPITSGKGPGSSILYLRKPVERP